MKRKIALNVISSGTQVFIVGIVYFILYHFLLKQIGVELLGVWSLVLATTSLTNLANFGVATSVVRYIALYADDSNREKVKRLIFTAAFFLLILFSLISLLIIPFAELIFRHVIEAKYIKEALIILPYSVACLVINAIGGVYASVLDGYQKNYQRSIIFTLSSLILLGLTYALVRPYGLRGVAMAQVAQSVFTLLCCLVIVIRIVRHNPFKWRWDPLIFKEIFAYGIKFQAISICSMLNEPVTKIFLSKFGGLAFTGYFEMANRLVMQVRGIIVNGNQSLIPVIVSASGDTDKHISIYQKSFSFTLFSSLLFISVLCAGARVLVYFWIGHFEPVIINNVLLLGVALLINLLSAPAYFAFMANGKLYVLLKSHIIMGLLNAGLGWLLGYYWGGYGATIGWLIGVSVGSIYLIRAYLLLNNMHKERVIEYKYLVSIVSAAGVLVLEYIIFNRMKAAYGIFSQVLLSLISILILVAIFLKSWLDEIRALIVKIKAR